MVAVFSVLQGRAEQNVFADRVVAGKKLIFPLESGLKYETIEV